MNTMSEHPKYFEMIIKQGGTYKELATSYNTNA